MATGKPPLMDTPVGVAFLLASCLAMWLLMPPAAEHFRKTPPLPPVAVVEPFIATAYCDRGVAKDGKSASPWRMAVDPAIVPLGTIVRLSIPEWPALNGEWVAADVGSGVQGHSVDLWIADCALARRFGLRAALGVRQPQPKAGDGK